ncbi:NUDIX hydrolase [Dermacoccaceae bacterium W4C1]
MPPRLASTVMLIRDGDAGRSPGLQVFMMRRAATMRFAPSAWVFPGGGVDERDGETPLSGADEAVPRWSTATGVSDERIRALAAAAAREVFEECGVLLAGSDPQSVVSDLSDPSWRADREALESHELSFAELLQRRGLVLRTDLLNLHDRWVTPEFEKVRYDTFFFAALMPPGQ